MLHPNSIQLLIAGGPGAPGGRALLARAAAAAEAGSALRVLLTGAGLGWMHEGALARLAEGPGVDVALCSRSARDEGLDPERIPPWVRWSSLLRALLDRPPAASVWALLP